MALQTLDQVVEQFRSEGDWLLAQSAELYVIRRVPPGEHGHILDD